MLNNKIIEINNPLSLNDDGKTQMYARIQFKISDGGDYITRHIYDVKAKVSGFDNDQVDYDFQIDWSGQGTWRRPQ